MYDLTVSGSDLQSHIFKGLLFYNDFLFYSFSEMYCWKWIWIWNFCL